MSGSQRSAGSLFLGIWSVIAGLGFGAAGAEDWPTFRHDLRRSGATGERIDARRLAGAWVHRSSQPPQPAWAGAADVDAYRKQRGLGDMRRYDSVDHCVVAGDAVFFGSSADDAVRCLDLATGTTRWRHTTGGPVRIPPTVAAGLVMFGSDDGTVRAVEAATGELVWRFRPASPRQILINDGRLVSPWPCRTGVAVVGGTAFFGMSMLPWKPTYLCAVDAATGEPDRTRRRRPAVRRRLHPGGGPPGDGWPADRPAGPGRRVDLRHRHARAGGSGLRGEQLRHDHAGRRVHLRSLLA